MEGTEKKKQEKKEEQLTPEQIQELLQKSLKHVENSGYKVFKEDTLKTKYEEHRNEGFASAFNTTDKLFQETFGIDRDEGEKSPEYYKRVFASLEEKYSQQDDNPDFEAKLKEREESLRKAQAEQLKNVELMGAEKPKMINRLTSYVLRLELGA